jgi:hypothetical protein
MTQRAFLTFPGGAALTWPVAASGLLLIGVVLVSSRRQHGFDWRGFP